MLFKVERFSYRISWSCDSPDPLKQIFSLWEGRYPLFGAHHQHHELLLQSGQSISKFKCFHASKHLYETKL